MDLLVCDGAGECDFKTSNSSSHSIFYGLKDRRCVFLRKEMRVTAEQMEARAEGQAVGDVLRFGDGDERVVVAVELGDSSAACGRWCEMMVWYNNTYMFENKHDERARVGAMEDWEVPAFCLIFCHCHGLL